MSEGVHVTMQKGVTFKEIAINIKIQSGIVAHLIMQIGRVAYNRALSETATQGGSTTTVTVKKARTAVHATVICGTTFANIYMSCAFSLYNRTGEAFVALFVNSEDKTMEETGKITAMVDQWVGSSEIPQDKQSNLLSSKP